MAERTDQRTRDPDEDIDIDALTEPDPAERDRRPEAKLGGRIARVRRTVGSWFSLRSFLVAFVTTLLGAVAFGMVIPFFGSLAALGGIFAVAFAFGALGGRRRYLELGIAGATTAILGTLAEFLVIAIVGEGQLLAVFGAGSGLLAALVGHYLGRDLRAGMTRDI